MMKSGRRYIAWLAAGCALFLCAISPALGDTNTTLGDRSGEGSTPFIGLAQAPEANLFTGALATSIPIQVPPGRKNVTPKLALGYSSSGGPSPYGYGWDLPLGRIERSTKWGTPRCTGPHTDDFVLVLPDSTAELVNDPPGSNFYRPAIEQSWIQAEKIEGQNEWIVHDRSGMKYVFGGTAVVGTDTSAFMTMDADGYCRFTSAWGLTHVEDPNGNSMDITYRLDLLAASNVLYPWTVSYGGNRTADPSPALDNFYHVVFSYDDFTNDTESYRWYRATARESPRRSTTG